ncbi:nitroreductase/quinone reductase family protein [Nocardia sp. NPDC004068]|uniref:nitroreductase/quinone reductase family protein n=1 Tax=Nocardia sp. NPDC004068 TaxID=3364303 RepID=UPI00367745B6
MTSPTTTPPSRLRAQSLVDSVMRALLRSPLHRALSGKLMIVTVVGRKTGRVYANPVGYAEHDGALLVGTAAGWRRNLQPGEPVRITWRGRTLLADWEVISDEEALVEPYRIILSHNPTHGRFAGIELNPDGGVNREQLHAAVARGTVVVRLRPRAA